MLEDMRHFKLTFRRENGSRYIMKTTAPSQETALTRMKASLDRNNLKHTVVKIEEET